MSTYIQTNNPKEKIFLIIVQIIIVGACKYVTDQNSRDSFNLSTFLIYCVFSVNT